MLLHDIVGLPFNEQFPLPVARSPIKSTITMPAKASRPAKNMMKGRTRQ